MIAFIYLCILLFIIIFTVYLIYLSLERCPVKIRNFYLVTLILVVIRYISLLSLWVIQSQKVIYFIKDLTQLTFIGIPLLVLSALYIFLRDENRSFDYNYTFMITLILVYLGMNVFYKLDIKIDSVYGFVVSYKDVLIPSLFYLIILSSLVVITLLFVDKPYSNNIGMKLLLLSLIITVSEYVVFLGGIKIFPYSLIGEVSILGCSYKAINTFKK